MSVLKKVIIGILTIIVFWIIGCFAGLPLIPLIETSYFISESDKPLADGYFVTHAYNEITKIEIPNYFPENDQCLDFWFTCPYGKHLLTVENFRLTAKDNKGTEIEKLNSYLFWDNGSEDEKFSIINYDIDKTGNQDKYVFFRTVVDLSGENKFSINIKADYYIDSVKKQIDKTFAVEKNTKLTWNEFSVH